MAAPVYPTPTSTRTPDSQGSLRDFLNSRMAPFLKRAIKESLADEPEYPLRYLGEHLINQSLQYERDPKKPEIKQHFQYNFDRPAPQAASSTPGPQGSVQMQQDEVTNHAEPQAVNGVGEETGHVNGEAQDQAGEGPNVDVEMKESA